MIEGERWYSWEALTRDGKVYPSGILNENNRGGYDALPHDKLAAFSLRVHFHKSRSDGAGGSILDLVDEPVFTMHLEPEERLIYRGRVSTASVFGDEIAVRRGPRLILVGARKSVGSHAVQRLVWIFESNSELHFTDRFKDRDSWFYSPVFRHYEVPR